MADLVVGVGDEHLHRVAVRQPHDHLRGRTEIDETVDHRGHVVLARAPVLEDAGPLGTDDDLGRATGTGRTARGAQLEVGEAHTVAPFGRGADRVDHEEVGDAQEVGDVGVGGFGIDLPGRADLRDATVVHHGQAVAHRERLFLVVGHVDERDPDIALQRGELDLERLAQLRVERAERLVEQEHRRLEYQGTRERDALLLPSRELRGLALGQPLEPHQRDRVADPPPPVGLADTALPPQAVGHVVLDREVRNSA